MSIPPFSSGVSQGFADRRYSPNSLSLYNPSGLDRWNFAAGRATTPGAGGIDVLIVGDSKNEGTGASDYWHRWPHLLKIRLQNHYNPTSPTTGLRIPGGFGFVPCHLGEDITAGVSNLMTLVGAETYNGSGVGVATRNQRLNAGTNAYYYRMDGSAADAPYKRAFATSFEIVMRRGSALGTARIDASTGSAPTIGSGTTYTGTIATAGSGDYGRHWGINTGTISRTANNFFQMAAPASGNQIFPDGMIFYDGDENAGVRLHNLAHAGTKTDSLMDTGDLTILDSNGWNANIVNWCLTPDSDTTTTGASRTKLIIFNWMTNDDSGGTNPANSLDVFMQHYTTQVASAVAQPSLPSVLLLVPPIGGGGSSANRQARAQTWVPAIKGMCETYDHVAALDLWGAMGSLPRESSVDLYSMGFDNLHENDRGQAWIAEKIFQALTSQVL